jgi:hypothetical protein
MEFNLVIELKLVLLDTGYFIGLTPAENSQTQLGKFWDKFTPEMKQGIWISKTLHKEDPAILHGRKNYEYQGLFTSLLLQVILALNHVRMQPTHKIC